MVPMSHNIQYFDYPENVDKKAVKAELDDYAAHADWQEGCTGLYHDIRWLGNIVCSSYPEAERKLEELDRGDYDQLAVLFHEDVVPKTKKFAALASRKKEMEEKLRALESGVHYSVDKVKSSFVTCRHCGSKIATKYITRNSCPVCNHDMRPKTVLDTIERQRKKLDETNRKIEEEIAKASKNAPKRWLVKIEYHT